MYEKIAGIALSIPAQVMLQVGDDSAVISTALLDTQCSQRCCCHFHTILPGNTLSSLYNNRFLLISAAIGHCFLGAERPVFKGYAQIFVGFVPANLI